MTFTLASLPNYTEFTTLFDHYRINYIDLLWVYSKNTAESNNYTTDKHQMPMLLTAIDKNDAVAMDEASLMQYPSFRVDQLDRPIRRRIYPKPTVAAYSGAFTSYMSPTGNPWIDTQSPGVQYYGCKFIIKCPESYATSAPLGVLSCYAKYNMSFKGAK